MRSISRCSEQTASARPVTDHLRAGRLAESILHASGERNSSSHSYPGESRSAFEARVLALDLVALHWLHLGGTDVFNTSCFWFGNPDVRDRLRRGLFVTHHFAVADAIAGADDRGVIVSHDSRRCGVARKSSLYPGRHKRRGRSDGDVDEHRFGFTHVDLGRDWVGFGNSRTRPTVLSRVPDRGDVQVPLRDSPGNGGNGRRSVKSRTTPTFPTLLAAACERLLPPHPDLRSSVLRRKHRPAPSGSPRRLRVP